MAGVAPVLVEGATGTAAAATAGEGAAAGRAASAGSSSAGSVGVGRSGAAGKTPARSGGKPAAGGAQPPVDPAPDQGAPEPSPDQGSRPETSRPSPALERSVNRASAASGGAILGVITYVLALTYLRNGSAGVKAWLKAKFINETATTKTATKTTSSTTTGTASTGSTTAGTGSLTVGKYW